MELRKKRMILSFGFGGLKGIVCSSETERARKVC